MAILAPAKRSVDYVYFPHVIYTWKPVFMNTRSKIIQCTVNSRASLSNVWPLSDYMTKVAVISCFLKSFFFFLVGVPYECNQSCNMKQNRSLNKKQSSLLYQSEWEQERQMGHQRLSHTSSLYLSLSLQLPSLYSFSHIALRMCHVSA